MIETKDLFNYNFGSQEQGVYDLTPMQIERGMNYFVTNSKPFSYDFSSVFRIFDRKLKYLHDYIKNMMPVGTILSSFDPAPFNKYFLSLNGELISAATRPLLHAKLKSLGFAEDGQGLIKLPDMRGTVLRAQNKGRFGDVAEIDLGKYQADATQRVSGVNNWQFMLAGGAFSGPFSAGNHSGYHGTFSASTASGQGAIGISFDNSRIVRTALEERVKATGAHFQIFAGIED